MIIIISDVGTKEPQPLLQQVLLSGVGDNQNDQCDKGDQDSDREYSGCQGSGEASGRGAAGELLHLALLHPLEPQVLPHLQRQAQRVQSPREDYRMQGGG